VPVSQTPATPSYFVDGMTPQSYQVAPLAPPPKKRQDKPWCMIVCIVLLVLCVLAGLTVGLLYITGSGPFAPDDIVSGNTDHTDTPDKDLVPPPVKDMGDDKRKKLPKTRLKPIPKTRLKPILKTRLKPIQPSPEDSLPRSKPDPRANCTLLWGPHPEQKLVRPKRRPTQIMAEDLSEYTGVAGGERICDACRRKILDNKNGFSDYERQRRIMDRRRERVRCGKTETDPTACAICGSRVSGQGNTLAGKGSTPNCWSGCGKGEQQFNDHVTLYPDNPACAYVPTNVKDFSYLRKRRWE